jgi:hypothetical protein
LWAPTRGPSEVWERTPIRQVALAVGRALAERGICAVLTGGACASIHSGGRFLSEDLDFVLEGRVALAELDAAMAEAGFSREANRYLHPRLRFWVEFPRGPLAVGADIDLVRVHLDEADARTLALSPTDSCRDHLAALYHWDDRQSLGVALEIARRHEVDLVLIRRWSAKEGHTARCEEFLRDLSRPSSRARARGRDRRS